jgi:hypothetical protein
MWQIEDNSDDKKGYLRILKDGHRVADVFPFAAGTDAAFVKKQAHRIVDQMNLVDMVEVRDPALHAIDPHS